MKSLIKVAALAAVLIVPAASFAQAQPSDQPVTRAQVKSELKQLESVGYNPAIATDASYPADIQAAEARVAAQNNSTAQADTTGYGPAANGTSQGGHAMSAEPVMPPKGSQ